MHCQIMPASLADWEDIREIYRDGILTGEATFNTVDDIPDGEIWFAGNFAGMVFKAINENGVMAGWTALSPYSKRRVYQGVAEVSVYVAKNQQQQGVGKALLAFIIEAAENAGIWTIQAQIFTSHIPSIRLHEKMGFRQVGVREKIGQQFGKWRDVVLLERRSENIL